MSITLGLLSLLAISTTVFATDFGDINWQLPNDADAVITRDPSIDSWYTGVHWLSKYNTFTTRGFFTFNKQTGFVSVMQAGGDEKYFFVVLSYSAGTSTPHIVSALDSNLIDVQTAAKNYLKFFGTECTQGTFQYSKAEQLFDVNSPSTPTKILQTTSPKIFAMLPAAETSKQISAVEVYSQFNGGTMSFSVTLGDHGNFRLHFP